MLNANELGQIKYREQEALRRKKAAFAKYTNVNRRLDDAYHLLLFAWEEFEDARDDLQNGRDADVRLKLAKKRHKSAQEEFLYQRKERKHARMELEMAQAEYWRWHKQIQQKLAEGGNAYSMDVMVTN